MHQHLVIGLGYEVLRLHKLVSGDLLKDKHRLLLGKVVLDLVLLGRKEPRLGKYVVVLRKDLLHPLQRALSKQSRVIEQPRHAWKVVHLLVRLHVLVDDVRYDLVGPVQGPLLLRRRLGPLDCTLHLDWTCSDVHFSNVTT